MSQFRKEQDDQLLRHNVLCGGSPLTWLACVRKYAFCNQLFDMHRTTSKYVVHLSWPLTKTFTPVPRTCSSHVMQVGARRTFKLETTQKLHVDIKLLVTGVQTPNSTPIKSVESARHTLRGCLPAAKTMRKVCRECQGPRDTRVACVCVLVSPKGVRLSCIHKY